MCDCIATKNGEFAKVGVELDTVRGGCVTHYSKTMALEKRTVEPTRLRLVLRSIRADTAAVVNDNPIESYVFPEYCPFCGEKELAGVEYSAATDC